MRRFLKWSVRLSLSAALAIGSYLGILQLTGNFHEVIAGELYRSAQPTAAALERYIQSYGIKTVVNLRGESSRDWYRDEKSVTARLGVNHLDFKMSAGRELTPEESFQLISLLRDAPKPILIHCQGGSDRTGLASVMYLQQIANVDEETAEWQLSLLYGHVGVPFLSYAYPMDESWEQFEKIIGLPS
ncbi:protein tyrosine/serine phosphatase [Pseudorhizobium tarimense]|uniref:Protein tyrosine/serine phosphatase n=1 Tax=Pseudorhizobium tarimense TaxID=1079109 RepID=A0ABV2H2B8_9HYPH|nr:dual specificity protein phosphatase family protein [Pseudorhizobium tarimense]MCJ8517914.1 dual specificity protein phosphatase family protein [Pseudorhizobium tarimense]